MIQKCISFLVSPHTCFIVLLLIKISLEVTCLRLVNYSSYQNLYQSSYTDDRQNNTYIPIVEDNDPNYPYEQLLQLVEDTKRILSSPNSTEKSLLNNLDPSIYDDYLNGDISDGNIVSFELSPDGINIPANAGAAYSPSLGYPQDNQCLEDVQYEIPRRLMGIDDKEYFIVNVDNHLRQKYNSVICKNPNKKCGFIYAVEGYSYSCEQSFNRYRNFVSIPVGNRISVDQQRLQLFKVPDGCSCKASRNLD